MWLLILGFILFLGVHLSPGVLGLRAQLVDRLGEGRFLRNVHCHLGHRHALYRCRQVRSRRLSACVEPAVFGGPGAALVLVAVGFILMAALLLPTNIRRLMRHPMLWGITAWSAGHLLANGDLASMILFGGSVGMH